MPVTLVDHSFRDVPCRVPQSVTCTGRRVHRPCPLRRRAHLALNPAMESALQAEPGPIQRMFENAGFRLPFKAPLARRLIRQSEESQRMRCSAVIEVGSPLGRGRGRFRNAANRPHRACHAFAARGWKCCTSPRRSGGGLPSQSFKFRNQMLERLEILDCRH
jgi:hypothetical protein